MNEFKNKLIEFLTSKKVFEDFEFKKSKNMLYKKNNNVNKSVLLSFQKIPTNDGSILVGVEFNFGIKYDFLHKWLEEFWLGKLADYRDRYTILVSSLELHPLYGKHWNIDSWMYFKLENDKIHTHDFNLIDDILTNGFSFFEKYSNLNNVYTDIVLPSLNEKNSIVSGITIFEYLAIIKIIAPDTLESAILDFKEYQKLQASKGEPNSIRYLPFFDKIISKLQITEFDILA